MKTFIRSLQALGFIAAITLGSLASAQNYSWYKLNNFPMNQQEHSNWCWAASSSMILGYFGKTVTQCSEVNYALNSSYACGNSTFYWNSSLNQPDSTYTIGKILTHWGVANSVYNYNLSKASVASRIESNKPFVILWTWRSGGGHFVTVYGYTNTGNSLNINNPWPGEGSTIRSYSSTIAASDRDWTWTIVSK